MERVFNILFLCTGNSARSILAEAAMNHLATTRGRFRAFSAGSHPKGEVDPMALAVLQEHHLPTDGLRSKSWEEFATPDAPSMDFVFTVCDQAAAEECPFWPGHPMTGHWGVPDPAAVTNEAERRKAFRDAFLVLKRRIELFTTLPFESLSPLALQAKLNEIGGAVPLRSPESISQ
jgi:arsenate reductase (thioredoxin)